MTSKLHALCNERGKPIKLWLTAGQVSDYKGAAEFMNSLPNAKVMLADGGYDSDWIRAELLAKGIVPCIRPRKNRKETIEYDKNLYKQRHKIENMFAHLKDWRRVAMRYDRCAHTFLSTICLACIFTFYLKE